MYKNKFIPAAKEFLKIKSLSLWALALLMVSSLIGDKLTLFSVSGIGISFHKLYLIFLFAALFIIRFIKKSLFAYIDRPQKLVLGFMAFWAAYGSLLYLIKARDDSAAFVEMCYLYFNFLTVACLFMLLKTKRELNVFTGVLRAAVTLLVLLGLFEIMSGSHLWMSRLNPELFPEIRNPFLATGLWNNENDFCFVLAASGLLFPFWKKGLTRAVRVYYGAIQFILLFILVVNSSLITLLLYTFALIGGMILSRAGWLVTVPTLFVAAAMQTSVGGWLRNALITLYNNLLMGFNMRENPAGDFSIARSIQNQITAFSGGTGSMLYRLVLTSQGISMGISSFLLGVGPAQFANYVGLAATGGYSNPHNWWIEIFSQYGILVFLGYAALALYLFLGAAKKAFSHRSEEHVRLLGMIFLFFSCCVVPSTLIGMPFQWLIFAYLFCANKIEN